MVWLHHDIARLILVQVIDDNGLLYKPKKCMPAHTPLFITAYLGSAYNQSTSFYYCFTTSVFTVISISGATANTPDGNLSA